MIAYKPYSVLPAEDIPVGISSETPWISVEIDEGTGDWYVQQGFTVVTKEAYDSLVASLSAV